MKKQLRECALLDEIVKDGKYTISWPDNEILYDLRALSKYAKDTGIDPSQMSEKDLEKFVIRKPGS